MAITLDELRRQVKAEEPVNTQKASPKMTLEELRKTVGTTAPQTAGEVSPAVPVYTQPAFTEPAVPKKTVQQIYWENMHSGIEETDSMADRAEKLKSVIPEQKKKTGLPDVLNYQGIYNRQKAKEAAERIAKPAGNVLGGAMGAVNFAGELIDTAALNTVGGIATGIQAGAQSISGQRGQALKSLLDEGRNARLGADAGMNNKRLVDDLQKARKEEKLDKDAFGVQLLDEANKKATNLMKDMNPTEQFLTQTMMSVLENAYLMPLGLINPAAAGAALAASATGRSTYDSAKEGKSLSEAFTRGVIDGSIEMATEKIGVDAWLDILTGKGGGLIKNLAKQAGSEGIEEGMSYLAGWLMDVAQNNPDAKFSAQELLTSAAGGALSGLILGGGTAAMVGKDNYIRMRNDETSRQAEQAEQRVETAANATNTVRMKEEMLENPTAGISDFGEQGKPFDVSKLPQVRKQQIENPVESINDRGENTGKPIDIKQLPQQQKTAPHEVETENNKRMPENKKQPAKDNNVSNKKKKVQGASGKLPESVGAMKSGYYAAIEEYGAFPEGEKVTNPVDVPMSVDGEHGVTRGVRTIMEAAATAEDMLNDFEKAVADGAFNYDINRDKPAVEKAVAYIEKYGFENTYNEWRKKVDNKQTITKDDMTQAQIMYASAVAEGDYDIAMKLATDISIQATKAGQVVQSMRILKKTTPEGRLYYAQKSVEAIQDDVNEKYGDKAPELKVPQELLDNLKKAKTDEEIRKATAEINQAIADQLPFSWSNFINSWRYLAMLGNTRTQVRNVLSNCIGTVAQEYTHFVQAAIEDTTRKGKADRTSTLKAPTKAQIDYAAKDYEAMKDSLAGKGKYKNDSLSALQSMKNPFEIVGTWGKQGDEYIGLKGVIRKGGDKTMKVLSAWNNATNWAMDKGDQIFSERAYKRFFARYLAANDINPENITNSQLFKARNWATKQALESVYRENNEIANALSRLEKKWSKSDNLVAKAGGVALGGLMPFKSTPMNITKRAFEYTPAGIVLEAMQQAYSNKTKGQAYDMPEIINKAAKSLSGTSLIMLGAFLAKAGVLTGGLGDNKEDKMKKQMGQQAYSINIGDWSYTLDWGGAGMMPLFVGADIYQSNSEDEDWLMNIGNALANAGSPIIETSMMTGFMDALQSMAYEDNEIKKVGTAFASALSNYIGQFVPTRFGHLARAVDDTSRSSYTSAKGVFKPIAKTAQKMQNKLPGFSMLNVPYMDVWGNEEKNFGGNVVGRLAYNMLSPGYVSTKSNDKVEKMLADLYDKTGETSVLPSNYTTYKRVGDTTFRFTDKQFENYTKTYGQAAYDILEDLSGDKGFKSMKDAYKAEVIEKAYRYSTAIASNEVVDKALEVRQKNQKKALEKGVSAYYVFGGLIEADGMGSEGNANGSLSKSEVVAYIESRGGLSKAEKAYLFAALGNSNWKNPYA